METTHRVLSLSSLARSEPAEGRLPALYVMVLANGRSAKVGALEAASNASARLRRVQARQRARDANPDCYPMRLAVVVEINDLPIPDAPEEEAYERWAEVEHLEALLRLILARRVGRLAQWPDWIHVERPMTDSQWVAQVEAAWSEMAALGATR